MKFGLVGFAGSGKTTVFNTLTGLNVPVGFGGELRLGTVRVPDERIDRLSEIFQPRKTTYAEMSFSDVPGEHGAERKGLSSKLLQQIRDQEALCLVLRDFDNPALEGAPDPLGDLEAFHAECVFADLEIVDKRLQRAKKEQASPAETAAFQDFLTRTAWGDVWDRPGLSRRERSIATLAALTTGGHENEVAMHVRAALRNDLTRDEIAEVLLHTALYAGLPAANSAFAIMRQVFAELDAAASGPATSAPETP